MSSRSLWFITLLVLCHSFVSAQTLTNGVPPADGQSAAQSVELPNDPGQEILPTANPEAVPLPGTPVRWTAEHQSRMGEIWTLTGQVVLYYEDYVLEAEKITYHHDTSIVVGEGNLHLTGGPADIDLNADHGEMQLNAHTGRFYNVNGTLGVRSSGHAVIYTTPNPFVFNGRELLQTGQASYHVIDGSMTNCRLPKPDWELFSHSIEIANNKARTSNTFFKLLGVPLFYLPYLSHPVNEETRQSGFLIPVFGVSTTRGFTLGEQLYIVLGRSADLTLGSEYYSSRGFSPNGDFRYHGAGLNNFYARWAALLDRQVGSGTLPTGNQGGVDIMASGRRDFSADTRVTASAEYLSNYIYRLVFNNNYTQATDSEVRSTIALTSNHNGYLYSGSAERFQSFASTTPGDELRILKLPGVRFDLLDRPLGGSLLYGELYAALDHLGRAEPGLHARNTARLDLYPSISMPVHAGDWNFVPTFALRLTEYTSSQTPAIPFGTSTTCCFGLPTVQHNALLRRDLEASLDIRPPVLERDFELPGINRVLRHVIEPEIYYHYVTGIGTQAQNVLLVDTNDIATDTNEAGFSITQRFYLKPLNERPCKTVETTPCSQPREWASWQIEQKYFFDSSFGGALIPGRRNIFDTSASFTSTAFLTAPRNSSPIISRMRFEAINNLRVGWDFDYDPRAGHIAASNLFAGYSWGRTTIGIGHSFLNAPYEMSTAGALIPYVQNQQLQPYFQYGKPTDKGLSIAANGGYDLTKGTLQYGGIEAVYNKGCCGITAGYRRFVLGTVRDEVQYLYGFTLAGFGNAGDIRRSNTIFRDPKLPPLY
jgi:LPS-assembly protein